MQGMLAGPCGQQGKEAEEAMELAKAVQLRSEWGTP